MNNETLQAVVIMFGLLACFIAWVAIQEEVGNFMKGSLYFVGAAAGSALFTIGWFIHG